ncbi:MAG: aspartoacylase, partial [Planctomycetota bacterium]
PGPPFTAINDTLQNRRIALALPIPALVGLEESVKGPLLEYVGERGFVSVALEGGQHDDPRTIDRHEAAIWITLVTSGALQPEDVPDLSSHFDALRDAARGLPGILEIVYRQALEPGDGFRMEPGFTNFTAVKEGRLVARDHAGDVRIPRDGHLLLPLYQGQGEDGFFLGVEVRRFWLRLSAVLRRLRADRLMRLLPGVKKDPGQPGVLRCRRKVARWFASELFHLFGYRKLEETPDDLLFQRRPDQF